MSNARSPREVCSITIGINGLIGVAPPSLSGCPDFRLGRLLLLRRPKLLARTGELDGDPLHLGGDPIERATHAQVLADPVDGVALEDRLHGLFLLALLAQHRRDLVVSD